MTRLEYAADLMLVEFFGRIPALAMTVGFERENQREEMRRIIAWKLGDALGDLIDGLPEDDC